MKTQGATAIILLAYCLAQPLFEIVMAIDDLVITTYSGYRLIFWDVIVN